MSTLPRLALALSGSLFTLCAAAAPVHTMTAYTVPGSSRAFLYDINNHNQMVGNAQVGSDYKAFVAQLDGAVTYLSGPAGALQTWALGLSDGGTVVGAFSSTMVDDGTGTLTFGPSMGYIYQGGTYASFGVAGYSETVVRAISANGRFITGYSDNGGGDFLGWVYDTVGGVFEQIATGQLVIAQGVSDGGEVVGSRRWQVNPGDPVQRAAFRYQFGGGISYFNLAGQTDTRARSQSDGGLLAGWVTGGGFGPRAFIGSAADYALYQWGDNATYIEGLNNAGYAVGGYYDADGVDHALVFRPVPAPASLALALAGLALLARGRRRGA